MTRQVKAGVLLSILAIFLLSVSVLTAQQAKLAPGAPIPAQILAAKRVFVANAGQEEVLADDPPFSGGPDRTYNQFYAAMKRWGRYELVASPADADLCFEIRFTVPPAARDVLQGNSLATPAFDPQFRLEIRDPQTNTLLWGFTEHAAWAILKGNREKNFDQAMERIVGDAQRLSGQAAAGSK